MPVGMLEVTTGMRGTGRIGEGHEASHGDSMRNCPQLETIEVPSCAACVTCERENGREKTRRAPFIAQLPRHVHPDKNKRPRAFIGRTVTAEVITAFLRRLSSRVHGRTTCERRELGRILSGANRSFPELLRALDASQQLPTR